LPERALKTERKATWSLAGRHAGPDKPPTPVFINLDNVLTIERQNDLTTVMMVGGAEVYIDTMPETLIGTVAPAGPV
jgi:hypothetical protein